MATFIPMLVIGLLFFIFGFVTWLNGALIPFLQIISDLNEFQALLIAFCFYIAYVVMALPMSWVLDRTGYKNGMVVGLALWLRICFRTGRANPLLQYLFARPVCCRVGSNDFANRVKPLHCAHWAT